jgi:hypothetical protein
MIAYLDATISPTFIVDLILLKIFTLFLVIMALRTATSYGPQAAQANKELPSESSLNLTLTQHPRDEELEPREVCARLEVEPPSSLVLPYFAKLPHPGDLAIS